MPVQNRYATIIEAIFQAGYRSGQRSVAFEREDIVAFASELKIALPKNLGDLIIQLPIPNRPSGQHFEHGP